MKKKILLFILASVFIFSTVYALTYQIKTTVVSVGTTATALPSTPIVGRKYLRVQNIGTATVYIGASTVTADTAATGGIQITPYSVWEEKYDDTVIIYGIVASGTQNIVTEEGK